MYSSVRARETRRETHSTTPRLDCGSGREQLPSWSVCPFVGPCFQPPPLEGAAVSWEPRGVTPPG